MQNNALQLKIFSGPLKEHFGFKMHVDSALNQENIYCLHCNKPFAYHGSKTSLNYHLKHGYPSHGYQTKFFSS